MVIQIIKTHTIDFQPVIDPADSRGRLQLVLVWKKV